MLSSCIFSLLKLTEVTSNRESLHENLFTDSRFDVTSVNFNSEKVHEDDIFVRQVILQFFSEESKDYRRLKSPQTLYAL